MRRAGPWALLLGLILLSAVLRFHRLESQDIWGDEAFSISLSERPLQEVVAGAADTHPPLYPALLYFWLKLAGTSAFATRSLSALTGILIIPLIFSFAKRIAPTRPRVAWFAALLAAASPLLIYYSQETRMYEMVTLLALASVYFCTRLVPSPPQGYKRVTTQGWKSHAYFVSSLAAIYTHYQAFFVLAAQNVFVLIYWFKQPRDSSRGWLRDWLLTQALLAGCYLPWIAVQTSFLRGKASTRFDEWSWRGIEMIFGKSLLAFGAGLSVEFPVAHIAALILLVCAGLAVWAAFRDKLQTASPLSWIAPSCFGVPLVTAWILNPVMPFFFERYVLVALPGFYVTAALGLDYVGSKSAIPVAGVMGILLLTSAFSLSNYYYNDTYTKGKYGQMMAYLIHQAQPGDGLVLNNPLQKPLFEYYKPAGVPAFYMPDGAPLEDSRTRQQLADLARDHSRLWLVMFGNPAEYDPTGYLKRWLGAHSFKTYERGFVDASLVLYVMPDPATVQRAKTARLGDGIRLTGYDLNRAEFLPGQTVQVTLHWQTTAPVPIDAKVFTHLVAARGNINPENGAPIWAQMDGEPVGGSRPTSTWQVGEMLDDLYGLELPESIPPGDYVIEAGMYNPATMQRLPVWNESGARTAEDRILLETVQVKIK